jgi:chorismate mutase/prephenate dehydrogenase
MPELETLRKRIRDIDSKIIELLIERNDAAGEVGEVKKRAGIPLRNKDVEKDIIERYVNAARGSSFPEEAAEMICRLIISSSVEAQAPTLRKTCRKKITIVGGKGKMGRWLSAYFGSMGAVVNIIDVSEGSTDDLKGSDVVIVSVPISSVGSVLRTADSVCRKDALIFDIASVKSPFIPLLKDMAKRRKVCSVHPMFGPSAVSMLNKNVLICDCGCRDAVAEAGELFSNDDANVVVTTVERHDELMSYSLALAHAANISFFTALRDSGIPIQELNGAGSVTFDRTLKTSVPVSKENASLYHEIQRLNDNAEGMWDVYENAVRKVREASLSDDPKKFIGIMESGKEYLEKDHL